jgi:hypothetical protein
VQPGMVGWTARARGTSAGGGFTAALALVALFATAGGAWGRATVVRDRVCAMFDADGVLQFGARGLSTIAPNGVMHLVCRLDVPPPGVPVRLDPTVLPTVCGIEGTLTETWEERISPSGEATLECWVNPGRDSR